MVGNIVGYTRRKCVGGCLKTNPLGGLRSDCSLMQVVRRMFGTDLGSLSGPSRFFHAEVASLVGGHLHPDLFGETLVCRSCSGSSPLRRESRGNVIGRAQRLK